MPEAPLRILVVDDQALVRSGFVMMLSVEPDIEVVGEAADGAESVEAANRLAPDVVLMDVEMPRCNGIDACRSIVAAGSAKVLLLTTFDRDDYLFEGLAAGASGFLLKNTSPEELADAIRTVGRGYALLAPEVTRRVIERSTATPTRTPDRALEQLTPRELEVLTLVGKGLSNAEIAQRLVLGESTVKTHLSSVLAKLQLRDRVQAVVRAYESGLVLPGE